ncbi:hypothetical protein [Streptomyces sp. VRA16 Mangrove soil]|uniref:hypothetical protein n=1 Tax=Streptomyces sp. VRA16 Mangrove soil TaxID=2817434 RepID=UPI001A9DE3ED|nr:hypothetical protein [Streptomyces sp. VRA16 Mangrove soil]MBO1331296.1 hypothetical protein [Streptomyces sp. VRA16 Mangrove soil]
MRRTRLLTGALLGAATALLALAGPVAADDDSTAQQAPTEAGTSFRTAAQMQQDQKATASASTGDYLYWSFPADAGQRPTVRATVELPDAQARHGAQTWRIDVFDGLRRRQSCQYGMQARSAGTESARVTLACTLRTVRAWSEAWANDPLPGTYYVRLTVTSLASADLGQPVKASVEAHSKDIGGAAAVDGTLAAPLVPGTTASAEKAAPADGWSSGWWTSRWLWTGAGAVLAALAGIGGYALTRGSGRPATAP